MTTAKNRFLGIILAIAVFFGMCTVLTACKDNAGNGVFTGMQIKYTDMVDEYTDIFDANGEIKIVYRNPQLNILINTHSKFSQLGANVLYEPVLNAGTKIFCYYVPKLDVNKLSISKGSANDVNNAYETFKTSLDAFIAAKTNLEERTELDPDGVVEQSLLTILCEKYKQLVNDGCILGKKFSALYHDNIFEDYTPTEGQRYAAGQMKLTVLDKLNEFAVIEYNNRLTTFHNSLILGENNIPTNYADTSYINSKCVDVLKAYNKVKDLAIWEGTEPTITNEEKQIINLFKNMLAYDVLYQGAIKQYNEAIKNIALPQYYKYISGAYALSEFSAAELVYFDRIDTYFGTNATNMINYINKLCDKIKAFKGA